LNRKRESQANKDAKRGSSGRIFSDINKVISVDSFVLNYGSFLPGKLLGSTLNVGNNSSYEQIVELSIDAASFHYNKKELADKFDITDLPFPLDAVASASNGSDKKRPQTAAPGGAGSSNDNILNSEFKHEAWYIENPISRELTKRITLKLGPKAE
jgi:hypothetical protein